MPAKGNEKVDYKGFAEVGETKTSVNPPVGEWVDVPKGMVAAPDTYVDDSGVLRSCGDDSCVVWHRPGCQIRGIQAENICYDVAGAPWCPTCYESFEPEREALRQEQQEALRQEELRKRVQGMLGPGTSVKNVTINKESEGNE